MSEIFKRSHFKRIILSPTSWLIFLIVFLLFNNILYILKMNRYVTGDEHHYVGIASNYYRIYQNFDTASFGQMLDASGHRPPFFPFIISMFYLVFGLDKTLFWAAMANIPFIIILISAVYILGTQLFDKTTAFIAAFITAMYPPLLIYSRGAMSEFASTALVALALYFLYRTRRFRERKFVFLFSAAFSLSFLTRWTTPYFIAGPLFFVLAENLIENRRITKQFLMNLTVFLFVGLATPVSFYVYNLEPFLKYVQASIKYGPLWLPHGRLSLESATWYFLKFNENLTTYFYLLFLAGFIVSLVRFKKYLYLLIWFFVPYLIFTFVIPFKSDRFVIPIFPAIALISGVVISRLKRNLGRFFLISSVLTIGFLIFFAVTWAEGLLSQTPLKKIDIFSSKLSLYLTPYVKPPPQLNFDPEFVVDVLREDYMKSLESGENVPEIFFTISIEEINKSIYEIMKYRQLTPWIYAHVVGSDFKTFFNNLEEADYVISKVGNAIDDYHPPEKIKQIPLINEGVIEFSAGENSPLEKMATVKYSIDGSDVILYKKTREIGHDDIEKLAEIIIEKDFSIEKIVLDDLEIYRNQKNIELSK